ncbi:MAG: holdfast anchor protein HfaD [Asticcacaulis sp.]
MLARAKILTVGTILAAAPLLLTATAATSQEVIDHVQLSTGDIFAQNQLNVVENNGLTQAVTTSNGNILQTGNKHIDATVTSRQTLEGDTRALTTINGTAPAEDYRNSLGTGVHVTTQTMGNYGAHTAYQGNAVADTHQTVTADRVHAGTQINSNNNSIYRSGEANTVAIANYQAYQVDQGRLESTAVQESSSETRARTGVVLRYSPSPNLYTANAISNNYTSNASDRGSQEHAVDQTVTGRTESYVSANLGNSWHVANESTATGNNISLYNTGGSLVTETNQSNQGQVQSTSVMTAYQYGEAHSQAYGVGNIATIGNGDIYLNIDNNQFNSGPIDTVASFESQGSGYDAYVTADAVGNSVMGYACGDCRADMTVLNNQVNNGNVNAAANVNITSGRSIVSTSRAVGNSATYYVTGNQ